MGAIIMMRILVKTENITKFIQGMSYRHIPITDIYAEPEDDCAEFWTQPEQQGYYDPVLLYEELKDIVEDIWSYPVGDGDLKVGRDSPKTNGYVWESAKRRHELDTKNEGEK